MSTTTLHPRPNLRAARKEAGLDQASLAQRACIGRTLVAKLELGTRRGLPVVRQAVTRELSAALGRDLDEEALFGSAA